MKTLRNIICIILISAFMPAVPVYGNVSEPVFRALLVSCDFFPSRPSTAPAAENNVTLLSQALGNDIRQYTVIHTECNTICSRGGLEEAVMSVFSDANESDVSLFYISTHGVYGSDKPLNTCALVLSDGRTEDLIDAAALKVILDRVKGTKVLILDACNTGAMIGKGLSRLHTDEAVFAGADYKVLCSAGGSEESWYWRNADDSDPDTQYGAGYFTTVLADIFCFEGYSPADADRDECVTLQEAYQYLSDHYCASSPQVYPESDRDFSFFVYRKNASSMRPGKIISDLDCSDRLVSHADHSVRFSFTQWAKGQVYYQLVYFRNGRWDWEHAQMMMDAGAGSQDIGRKERTLILNHLTDEDYGYIMLLIITLQDDHAVLQCADLIRVEKADNDEVPKVFTLPEYWTIGAREAAVYIRHKYPCLISAAVMNEDGRIIRRIRSMSASRPMPFQGTMIYWDGRTQDGAHAPPGEYRIEATLYTSEGNWVALSGWFKLNQPVSGLSGDSDE